MISVSSSQDLKAATLARQKIAENHGQRSPIQAHVGEFLDTFHKFRDMNSQKFSYFFSYFLGHSTIPSDQWVENEMAADERKELERLRKKEERLNS